MSKILVLVDTQYLYHKLGRRLDYQKLMDYARELGEVSEAIAYGYKTSGNGPFQHMLKKVGFNPIFTAVNRSKIADITIASMQSFSETVLLLSGDPGLQPMLAIKSTIVMNDEPDSALSKAAFSHIPITEVMLCD